MTPHLAADPEFRERFELAAKSISALNHPNICALYDVGREGSTEYLVLEYPEGETLSARIAKGPLPLADALKIAVEIASALDKAHRQGIVHRHLKPGNVMLTKTGSKLLDFGLAKTGPSGGVAVAANSEMPTVTASLTARRTVLGTFQYMAPEQIEGDLPMPDTDLFAFRAVLYAMLTVWVAANYRITFGWSGESAVAIDFEDYIREGTMQRRNGMPRTSGRDYQGRRPSRRRPLRNGSSESTGRFPPDAS